MELQQSFLPPTPTEILEWPSSPVPRGIEVAPCQTDQHSATKCCLSEHYLKLSANAAFETAQT